MIIELSQLLLTENIYNQIVKLYSTFSQIDTNILTFNKFNEIIKKLPNNHYIFVYILPTDETVQDIQILGVITLIIEQKLIHNGKCCGHIEDFVVLEESRKKGIGRKLVEYAKNVALQDNCYKCILDCDISLEDYYIARNFIKKGTYMACYFDKN